VRPRDLYEFGCFWEAIVIALLFDSQTAHRQNLCPKR
jgi:hypothetical protein